MDDDRQITFMQARISLMASRKWGLPMRKVMLLFGKYGVLEYIEDLWGYFHLEGDEAVFDDIMRYLKLRGVDVDAPAA